MEYCRAIGSITKPKSETMASASAESSRRSATPCARAHASSSGSSSMNAGVASFATLMGGAEASAFTLSGSAARRRNRRLRSLTSR